MCEASLTNLEGKVLERCFAEVLPSPQGSHEEGEAKSMVLVTLLDPMGYQLLDLTI